MFLNLKFWQKPQQIVICKLDDDTQAKLLEMYNRSKAIADGIAILIKEVRKMAMDQAALDAAVAQEGTDVVALVSGINSLASASDAAFKDLLAKIAANPGTAAVDFTNEINALASNHTSIAAAIQVVNASLATAKADDPGSSAVPPASGAHV